MEALAESVPFVAGIDEIPCLILKQGITAAPHRRTVRLGRTAGAFLPANTRGFFHGQGESNRCTVSEQLRILINPGSVLLSAAKCQEHRLRAPTLR